MDSILEILSGLFGDLDLEAIVAQIMEFIMSLFPPMPIV